MAIYHLSIKIITRGAGKSAVAAAAYRAGETIKNEYDGIVHDYTRKTGIVHTEILLPAHAPAEYADRAVLWNAVEKSERYKTAQLAREIEIALPVELTREQNIALVRRFVNDTYVSAGMCADVCIHDKDGANPHAHIMLTMRPIEPDGKWGQKSRTEGGRKVNTVDWNDRDKADIWRAAWEDYCNAELRANGFDVTIDHRSYECQGIEQIPTVHLGPAASQMERRGIRTERGDMNRAIEVTNRQLRQLRARINKLQDWLAEEFEPPSLYDVIVNILDRRGRHGTSNLLAASRVLNFLLENDIRDMSGLEQKVKSMYSESQRLRSELKPVERRIDTLNEHIRQVGIYRKYKNKKSRTESEQILYTAAEKYLREHLGGHKLDLAAWKRELTAKTVKRDALYREYYALKDDTREVEQIKRSVADILQIDAPYRAKNARRDL